jgi:hypothetical protein
VCLSDSTWRYYDRGTPFDCAEFASEIGVEFCQETWAVGIAFDDTIKSAYDACEVSCGSGGGSRLCAQGGSPVVRAFVGATGCDGCQQGRFNPGPATIALTGSVDRDGAYVQVDGGCNGKPAFLDQEAGHVMFQPSGTDFWAVGAVERLRDCSSSDAGLAIRSPDMQCTDAPHATGCRGLWMEATDPSGWIVTPTIALVIDFGCRECTAGHFTATLHRGSNISEATGVDTNATHCFECPSGRFNQVSDLECETCLPGSVTDAVVAATSCAECTAGRSNPNAALHAFSLEGGLNGFAEGVYEQIDGVVCNDKPIYRLESHDYVLYQRSNSTQWAVGSLDRPHDCAGTSEGVLLYVKTCPHSADLPICEGQWEHWTGSEWQDDAVAVARVGCRECPVGQQQPSSGGPNCTYCSSGTFADTVASAVCRSCPRGYFTSDDVFDTDGTGVSSGAVACNECPIGTFNQLSGATCSTCSPILNAASVVCTNDTTSRVLMCSVGYHNATMHICQRKRAHFTVHLYCNMLRNIYTLD